MAEAQEEQEDRIYMIPPNIHRHIGEFLKKHPNPTEVEIRSAISGNICRCTGYQSIVAAALEAAGNLKKQEV